MKVGFISLGCKANSYDTESILSLFEKRGYQIVRDHSYADIFIINTCSVTNIAERKSRQAIERVLKLNPDAVIVVTGCYAQVKAEEVKNLRNVAVVAGSRDRAEIVDMTEEYLRTGKHKLKITDLLHNSVFEDIDVENYRGRTRVQLKIQDGCDNFCSYCIIPYTRGRVCSKSPEKIEEQARRMAIQGVKEIVVTGIHIGSYGKDIGNYNLIDIVEKICSATEKGAVRIRLGSLDPAVVTKEFAERLSKLDRLCPQFHLSLQSGSDSTLQRMNRRYTSDMYYDSVELLRKYFNNPSITTDVIVGFPGETDEEFLQTLKFVQKVGFAKIHIFPYSRREGTAAAKMQDQTPRNIVAERERVLSAAEKQMRQEYIDSYIGKTVSVLAEETKEIDGTQYACGYTPEYIYVHAPVDERCEGVEIKVCLSANKCDYAEGKILSE